MNRYILENDNREFLEHFLSGNPLLAFDYDGTLAPLSANRHETPMRPQTRELLERISRLRKCAVISGRAAADIRSIMAGIPVAAIVGNHGLEPSENLADFARRSRSWIPMLEQGLSATDGVEVEDKGATLSAHYRRARDHDGALSAIMHAARPMAGSMRVISGHCVVNFIPAGAPDKADALHHLMRDLEAKTALFVGDDWADEDVFRRAHREHVLTIRVGESQASKARYFLRSQDEIDGLLEVAARL